MKRKRHLQKSLLLMATGMVVVATSGTALASTTSKATAKASSSLTIGVSGIPTTLDNQAAAFELDAVNVQWNVGVGLLTYKKLPTSQTTLGGLGDVVPALASKETITKAGAVFTLTNAKAASGDVLSPADVLYTYQRDLGLKDGVGGFLMALAGVNAKNPITVLGPHTVRLNGTLTPLAALAVVFSSFEILDSKVVKAHATKADPWAAAWMKTHTASYGAYTVSSYTPNVRIAYTSNPNYYAGAPKYTSVIMTPYGTSAASLLTSGTAQALYGVPNTQFKTLKADSSLKTFIEPSLDQDVLTVDPKVAQFSDAKVREAMSMAINRAALLAGPYQGIGKASIGPVSSSISSTSSIKGPYFTFDVAKAKALMVASKYPKGFSFTVAINPISSSSVDVGAEALDIQSMLAQIGIKMSIDKVTDPSQFEAALAKRSYQAYIWSEGPITPDAAYDMDFYYVPTGLNNYVKISSPPLTALITKAAATPVGAQRDALAAQAVKLWDTQMWAIPLVDTSFAFATSSSVCGVGPAVDQTVDLNHLSPC